MATTVEVTAHRNSSGKRLFFFFFFRNQPVQKWILWSVNKASKCAVQHTNQPDFDNLIIDIEIRFVFSRVPIFCHSMIFHFLTKSRSLSFYLSYSAFSFFSLSDVCQLIMELPTQQQNMENLCASFKREYDVREWFRCFYILNSIWKYTTTWVRLAYIYTYI